MVFPNCQTGTTDTQLRIVGVNNTAYDFVGCPTPFALTPGTNLRGRTSYRIESRAVGVDIPGETVTNVRTEPRSLAVPIVIHGSTETDLDNAIGQLGGFLAATEGICRIIWTRASGAAREIAAYYQSGAETIRTVNLADHRHVEAQLVFRAMYPYWRGYGVNDNNAGANFFDFTFGGTFVVTFNNPGDVETWPEWTFTAPLENIEISNLVTGRYFRITEILTGAQTVRIDTDPRNRGVYLDDVYRPDILDPSNADLFPFVPGDNTVQLRAISPGDAGGWVVRWPSLFTGP